MTYKTKLKIKMTSYYLLSILTLLTIIILSFIFNKVIETILIIILFYIYRNFYVKQWHASSLYACSIISILVFTFLMIVDTKLSISVIFSVILTSVLTIISYASREYIDDKMLIKYYSEKLNNYSCKCIENLTEDEMIKCMPNIKYEIIHITYGYLHKGNSITASGYAYKCGISEATLYRYVKQVKEKYESLGQKS